MFKVTNRNGSVFGNEPYICEFVCDTTSDVLTLPTSISEGTGGKTKYDNQLCSSGSIATVIDNGSDPKKYILDNQNTWCPYSVSEGSSISITVDSSLSDSSKNPVENKVVTAAINNKAAKTDIPTSLPANGGNAATVNNHTVESDVPANAVFTDTWRGIQDSLTSDSAVDSLSANQGKILNEKVEQNKTDISQLFNITKGGETVSGEYSYTISNAVDYPLMGLNLYGKSTQDGTPTPDTPVDIVSIGDNGFDIISKNDTHFNLLSVRDNGGNIITKQPVSTVAKVGGNSIFSIIATGNSITYQWQYSTDNGKTWANSGTQGNNTNEIIAYNAKREYNGFQYRCIVTDENRNSEISNAATWYVFSDDCEITTASIATDALPLCGIPVESGGNYTDSNGQMWICDELIYNADGTGKIIKRTAKIDNYNGEAVSGVHISSTGGLDTGATVIYQIDTPQEIELTAAEMKALSQLQTFDGTTNISNSDNADMDVKYCTDKSLSECVLPITMGLQKQIDELQDSMQKQIDELQDSILSPGPLTIPGSYAETIIGPIITEEMNNTNG